MEFLDYTKKLNDLVISLQDKEEIISDEDIIKAIFYMNNMYIDNAGDCLIFLSALNLCNAYVKQNNSKISYTFKKGIEYIINVLNYRDIKDIYINCSNNDGKLYIFQIGNIQFSFHDEKKVEINERYLKEISWDGIRKQKCAKTIFDSAINNKICVTNITYRGKDLCEQLEKMLDNYKLGNIKFEDLIHFQL